MSDKEKIQELELIIERLKETINAQKAVNELQKLDLDRIKFDYVKYHGQEAEIRLLHSQIEYLKKEIGISLN